MIKKTFTITPESGSNNGKITVVAKENSEIIERKAIVNVQGGGYK